MTPRDAAYVASFFFASLVMLAGAIFFGVEAWESHASASWPHVPGVITGTSTERTCSSGRGSSRWEAKISYRYNVNGEPRVGHRSTNVRLYCDSRREDVVGWLASHYPVGKPVEVYYNPSDPEAAFLRPGVVSTFEIAMVFGALVVSALMALGGWLSLRRAAGTQKIVRRSVKLSFRIGRR